MAVDEQEVERRRLAGLAAINRAYSVEGEAGEVALFVSHHLDEIADTWWREHLGEDRPNPQQVLGLLELKSHWGEDDDEGLDTFDFTLPGGVTNYVIAVEFGDDGAVEQISMES